MAVLSDRSIRRLQQAGDLKIEPFFEDGLQPASYDLRLHWKILVSPTRYSRGGVIDLRGQPETKYAVEPGRFVGILSEEVLGMPLDLAARFGVRSEYTRQGLVAFGGIQIDPGFKGRMAMSLFNAGPEPVGLALGRKVFTIEFQSLDAPASGPYVGAYQGQEDFPQDQEEFILNAHTVSLAEINHLPVELGQIRQQLLARLPSLPHRTLAELAASQGIKPVETAEELTGGWPDGQDLDAFLGSATEADT